MNKVKAFFTKHERLTKSITLLLLIVTCAYVSYGFNQAFKGYDIQNIEGKRYSNKSNTKFLYFNDESQGMYIYDKNGAAEFFSYTIQDGRIDLTYYNEQSSVPKTYYLISLNRLYSRKSNMIFYEFSSTK